MQPFKLAPAYKDYLWGGTRLRSDFGKKTHLTPLAESWELSAHPDGPCVVATGPLAGSLFTQYIAQNPAAVGEGFAAGDTFPVLIKLIDALQPLSIQVHPDDEYGQRVEGEPGKTEMWIVLDAQPDAFLYFGFERQITPEEMRRRIEEDSITEVLHKAPVKPGDVFFIPAGTIHAIGAGILLAEVQQNSNTTYRVYDFGRLGADGKPRELHVDKALAVTNTAPASFSAPGARMLEQTDGYTLEQLASCEFFTTRRLTLQGSYTGEVTASSFVSVLCTGGCATLKADGETLELQKGDSAFLPAGSYSYTIAGNAICILTTV